VSRDAENQGQCDAIHDELAELALGILSGRRRSEVLRHVETCQRCAREVDQLSLVADALLELTPEMEPPIGFEVRFAERLASEAPATVPRRGRRIRRVSVLAAVAAVVVLLAFLLGMLVAPAHSNPQATPTDTVSANLVSHGRVAGQVMVSAGRPAWIFMTVDLGAVPGKVTCDVTLAGGEVVTVGTFQLSGKYGAWGAPLKVPAGQVRSAQLVAANGTVLASAELAK
jgi:hypothetical protein